MAANEPMAAKESMAAQRISQWRHVFKLDPDKDLDDAALERVCVSGTDAILVGGSSGVTYDNTAELLSRIRRFSVPCALEVSSMEAIVPGFDLYLIPVALNAADRDWILGLHHEAVMKYGARMPWPLILTEGYVILNPASTAARLTGAMTGLNGEELAAYARLAEHLFRMPVFYVEYSGMFGDMDKVAAIKRVLKQTRLFYGGGIDSYEKAAQAAAVADTIVVGNVIYADIDRALETVRVKTMGKGTDRNE